MYIGNVCRDAGEEDGVERGESCSSNWPRDAAAEVDELVGCLGQSRKNSGAGCRVWRAGRSDDAADNLVRSTKGLPVACSPMLVVLLDEHDVKSAVFTVQVIRYRAYRVQFSKRNCVPESGLSSVEF